MESTIFYSHRVLKKKKKKFNRIFNKTKLLPFLNYMDRIIPLNESLG